MPACPHCGRDNPDEARFCLRCGRPLEPTVQPREARKVVTVLFSDVIGSTGLGERLDPETMRRVMAQYFEEMKTALEAHGGTVEKFIGDAVMAVFGIPVLHEDDALRAVRAAMEMRERLAKLNEELERNRGVRILTRTGINTGEVVAGEPATGQTLVTGDAVNVAARLEQAAKPGEVLIGEPTYRVLRYAVSAEPLEPVSLKGKEDPVDAFRLLDILPGAEAVRRRLDSPMVGRDRQLGLLSQIFGSAVADRACHLFTVIGSPGVGKSRLVYEFVDAVQRDALVLRGRCLPYGDGITYWAVAEMVKQAAAITDGDDPDGATSKIAALVPAEEREPVADRLMQAFGLAETKAPAEEIAWAFRKLLQSLARTRPVVAVFDDLQWAEPTLLDLIDHVADWSRDAPILVACLARPELFDARPAWGGGKVNASTILLEPLPEEACEALVQSLLGTRMLAENVRRRIILTAEGNPLFIEQMVAMLSEVGANGDVSVPPTIQALIAARLDRLPTDEREVAERASVIGKESERAAVEALVPEPLRPAVATCLLGLVRKELIRPHAEGDAFRFANLLIRDASYEAMSKELRAELHERFAAWFGEFEAVPEQDELLGHHLEQAYRYQTE